MVPLGSMDGGSPQQPVLTNCLPGDLARYSSEGGDGDSPRQGNLHRPSAAAHLHATHTQQSLQPLVAVGRRAILGCHTGLHSSQYRLAAMGLAGCYNEACKMQRAGRGAQHKLQQAVVHSNCNRWDCFYRMTLTATT